MTAQARFVRRRIAALCAVVAVCVLAVTVVWPALHHAVRALTLPLTNAAIIRQQASEKHLDPTLIAAVIFAESKFNPRTSAAGATGLMQLEPSTAKFIARRTGGTQFTTSDLATPQVNIAYGSYYLRYLLDRYGGDVALALAAYNGGETNVDSWLAHAHSRGDALTIDAIPFPETRAYVRRVLDARQAYRSNYARELGLG
jgi:soluble lytic murein transglycosylase